MDTPPQQTNAQEREIFDLFRIGVIIKGIEGFLELIASALIYFVPLDAIVRFAEHFTENELTNDPNDFIANHLVDWAHSLSIGAKEYAAIYLLLHAIVKIGLAVGLLSGKRWAYPIGIGVIGLFVVYQSYRIYLHHSPLLFLGTLLDCVIIYLIWREYAIVREHDRTRSSSGQD